MNGDGGAELSDMPENSLGAPSPLRGTRNPEKIPITAEQIANVREQFRSIFDKGYSTLGHGARKENPETILTDGLGAKVPELLETAEPLFLEDKEYDEQPRETFAKLMDWPHWHAKAVVIIQIPNPDPNEENYQGPIKWFNSVFEDTSGDENRRYKIPKEYIRGYWNAVLGQFIPNPDFAPKKPHMEKPGQDTAGGILSDREGAQNDPVIKDDSGDGEIW